ncbi:hypothetical protein QBC40DRAFT_172976 [Triangularia verruculosa]|uniref:Uncharacterized protein n=1 Tax=Triangularia verruculosa TaxID=2587418 RepID=A0AAN6XIF3_9PEZI|nr:hypothetical protein QBC40DRAFT_172976 [Triangularia verruculosa]
MRLLPLLLTPLALASPAQQLNKRCRLGHSIMPCWVYWNHSDCEAFIPSGVTYEYDSANKTVTVRGLCESCSTALVLEREQVVRDTWATSFGSVEDFGNGTFVITDTGKELFKWLGSLEPVPYEWATSCVWLGRYGVEDE